MNSPEFHYIFKVLTLKIFEIQLRPNSSSDKEFNTINRMVKLINKCKELPKNLAEIEPLKYT